MSKPQSRIVELYNGQQRRIWSTEGVILKEEKTGLFRGLGSCFCAAFVPIDKTSEDYVAFQIWDSIQGLCSYIRGMLSSQAILRGILTDQSSSQATAGSAVYAYFMRDVSGMIGGILFAAVQGSGMDSHAKQWRLFADCFNNVGYILELISPLFPSAFLLLACLGSLARAITGVAAGATRSALTYHFAQQGNAGDISAKEGSQETAVTLVGMSLGMSVVHFAEGNASTTWTLFLALTGLHIFANVRAMQSLQLTSLNSSRLDLILKLYATEGRIAGVKEVAVRESLLAPPIRHILSWIKVNILGMPALEDIVLGASFKDLGREGRRQVMKLRPSYDYFVWPVSPRKILIVLSPSCPEHMMLDAYAEARLKHFSQQDPNCNLLLEKGWGKKLYDGIQRAGWDLTSTSLGETKWRVESGHALHVE